MSILASIFSFLGCRAQSEEAFKSVKVDEFETVIADTAVVRLDVRTAEEYAEGHISGALNIDVLGTDFTEKAVEFLPAGRTIALYCRSGRRSKRAAEILSSRGYKVVELDTGYNGWVNAGKTVVKD